MVWLVLGHMHIPGCATKPVASPAKYEASGPGSALPHHHHRLLGRKPVIGRNLNISGQGAPLRIPTPKSGDEGQEPKHGSKTSTSMLASRRFKASSKLVAAMALQLDAILQ